MASYSLRPPRVQRLRCAFFTRSSLSVLGARFLYSELARPSSSPLSLFPSVCVRADTQACVHSVMCCACACACAFACTCACACAYAHAGVRGCMPPGASLASNADVPICAHTSTRTRSRRCEHTRLSLTNTRMHTQQTSGSCSRARWSIC